MINILPADKEKIQKNKGLQRNSFIFVECVNKVNTFPSDVCK